MIDDMNRTTLPQAKEIAQAGKLDGIGLKRLVEAGTLWLKANQQLVNSLNVFPVPDGDTGTNMLLTMQAAYNEILHSDERNVGKVAHAIAQGALMGARGNSGVILSQLWRGFARALDTFEEVDGEILIKALVEAKNTAYKGVVRPVEGTILTVAKDIATAIESFKGKPLSMEWLEKIVFEADLSVQKTPELLPILKQAGVVDSGGKGLFIILEGMWRFVNGLPVEDASRAASSVRLSSEANLQHEGGWGYDVQYLIYARSGQALDVAQIRADIEAMGECPLVMGDEHIVKVHVHVPDPGVPISYGARLGSLRDVVVEDMQAQSEAFTAHTAPPARPAEESLPAAPTAIVAVASGDGLARAFKEVGVRVVVEGGQTMNPSVDDFLNAIAKANARSVILLPNNGNVIMTAEQAAEISETPACIVATRTVAQGIAAAIAFNPDASAEENAAAMREAAQRVTTGEITVSTRDATINGVRVRAGQVIGLIDDQLAVADDGIPATLLALLEKANARERELITLFYGNGLTEAEATPIAEAVRQTYPSHQVELVAGGQPHYYFIVSIE
ncbi:DAK2 domain-containing protein [Candidatus Roseilinea sp. NK_OTU-006]|jgi:DAK2 domain fusion protein YloV|uniref:DAK2 domain-containing protein n=1 Tax=Candidatus Roseilinea sp. NK_OTU-006 TaxID=2704250 RepID=UPI00145EDCCD|nr:DAK2 domain-containing protein [Candidatus Roseilinea sp. NK_OTU-006]